MNKVITPLLLIFILIQCIIYHKPRLVAQLTAKISEEIAKKYGIRFCGVGGGGTTKEGEMLVIFEFQRWGNGLTISEGRKLIVNVVNDFLTTFNANEEVRPYLKTYPFTSKNISASFHKSAESQKLVEAAGCKIFFLPPYSPDLNPIEKYWANMKKKVREFLREVQNFSEALDRAILSI